jgi:hypothetical protein
MNYAESRFYKGATVFIGELDCHGTVIRGSIAEGYTIDAEEDRNDSTLHEVPYDWLLPVDKLDYLIDYDRQVFNRVEQYYEHIAHGLPQRALSFEPMLEYYKSAYWYAYMTEHRVIRIGLRRISKDRIWYSKPYSERSIMRFVAHETAHLMHWQHDKHFKALEKYFLTFL